jgi:hypothetical protein
VLFRYAVEPNEAITVDLCDCYNRCIVERRLTRDLMVLHEKWSRKRIGGVVERGERVVTDRPGYATGGPSPLP